MKKQKRTIYVLLMLLLFMACSKDNLNVEFPKQPEEQFFTDEQKLDRGIRGVYAQLTDLYSFGGMTCVYPLYLLPSDAFTQEAGGSNNDIDNFKGFNASHNLNTAYWNLLMRLINRANTMLDITDKYDALYKTSGLKDTHRGECYFLRGYAFYKLFENYGKPPIITKRITSVDDPLIYTSESSGLAALDTAISDLIKAEILLANTKSWNDDNLGRVTYNSVEGMLVKLYTIRANYSSQAEDYQNAIAAFDKIDQSITSIENVIYGTNFDGTTENNKESLFEYQAGDAPSGDLIWLDNDFGGNIGRQGACFVFFNMGGGVFWTWNQPLIPTDKLVNKFERNDPRFIECMDSVSIYTEKYDRDLMWFGGSYKTGFVFHKYMRPGVFLDRADHDKGLKYNPRDTYGKNGYGAAATTTNPRILRFADVKLLVAEAYLETGNSEAALQQVNDVRARARISTLDGTVSSVPADLTTIDRQAIMDERMRELCGEEDHRLGDMRRWQKAGWIDVSSWLPAQPENEILEDCWGIITNVENFDPSFGTDKNLLFPIPQDETSTNSGITQNDGY
jgi:tetratricopeptide (TPR) repeat protein